MNQLKLLGMSLYQILCTRLNDGNAKYMYVYIKRHFSRFSIN